jgi:hypothetical protein
VVHSEVVQRVRGERVESVVFRHRRPRLAEPGARRITRIV